MSEGHSVENRKEGRGVRTQNTILIDWMMNGCSILMLTYFDEKEGKTKIGYRGPFIIVHGAVSSRLRQRTFHLIGLCPVQFHDTGY